MKTRTKKAGIMLLMLGIIYSTVVPASDCLASVTWLSTINNVDPNNQNSKIIESPVRVALDSKGNLYVTEGSDRNRLRVFDRHGTLIRTLTGLKTPKGVAVDSNFNVYIGNYDTGSVDVYNRDFAFVRKLGKGDKDFKFPTAIAVSATGRVFVVDHDDNMVKAYNPDGTSFSFGGWGKNGGQFNEPTCIAVDDANGKVYVTDFCLITDSTNKNATMGGACVQTFNLDGVYQNQKFGTYGTGAGQIGRPLAIAAVADDTGSIYLYIADAFQAAIHVFSSGGVWKETLTDRTHLKTPTGIAVGKDKRVFVASSNGSGTDVLDVYGLDGYTTMDIDASLLSLSFEVQEGAGIDPAPQSVTITNSGTGTLTWSAAAVTSDGGSWLVPQTSGSIGPKSSSQLSIGVKSTTLVSGVYTGTVTVTAGSGAEDVISVRLTVTAPPAVLSVAPASLSFKVQQNGPAPQPQTLSINNLGSGKMSWTASATQSWLALTASSSFLTVSPNTSALTAGTAKDTVTITSPGASGSPAKVPVSIEVIYAGTVKVTTNSANAAFDITGPVSYSGTGKAWSRDDVTPGDYTITFKHVSGYFKPMAQKFSIKTGQQIDLSGNYRKKPVATHILAGSADPSKEMNLLVLPFDPSKPIVSFAPFAAANSIRVAAGDLDGSGSDKIVATDNKRSIKVFAYDKTRLASYDLPEGYNHADVVVGDLDNDGKADIIIGAQNDNQPRRVIKMFSYAANALQEKATLYSEDKTGAFSIALGDVNDDGALEVLLADSTSVRAFTVTQSSTGTTLTQLWTKSGDYGTAPQISAGDLNDDGSTEIAVSYEHVKETKSRGREGEHSSYVSILKATGEDYGLTIEPFKDLGYLNTSTVVMGDIDGDGVDELVVGAGPAESNPPVIRTFESDGTYAGMTAKPMDGKFGVNVGLGTFQ